MFTVYFDVSDMSFYSLVLAVPFSSSFKDPLSSWEKIFNDIFKLHESWLSDFLSLNRLNSFNLTQKHLTFYRVTLWVYYYFLPFLYQILYSLSFLLLIMQYARSKPFTALFLFTKLRTTSDCFSTLSTMDLNVSLNYWARGSKLGQHNKSVLFSV